MLKQEAQWVGDAIRDLSFAQVSPLLNVGSGTAEFRQQLQPWIDQWIFAPLRQRSVEVCHLDLQHGEGVDLSGDLNDGEFSAGLSARGYQTVLCCNLLEHVRDPGAICAKLERILRQGGYIIVTVPYRFPYHPDPIDTMFRPTPNEVAQLFPHCQLISGTLIDGGTVWDYVEHDPWILMAKARQRLASAPRHGGIKGSASFLPWLFRRFQQTCVLMRKFTGLTS